MYVEVFSSLRLYAIWTQNIKIALPVFILSVAPLGLEAVCRCYLVGEALLTHDGVSTTKTRAMSSAEGRQVVSMQRKEMRFARKPA